MSLSDTICAHVAQWTDEIKVTPAGQRRVFSLAVLHLTRMRFQELLPLFRPLTLDGEADVEVTLENAGTLIVVHVQRQRPTTYRITPSTGSDLNSALFFPRGSR